MDASIARAIASIFSTDPRALNLVHYATGGEDDVQRLIAALDLALIFGGGKGKKDPAQIIADREAKKAVTAAKNAIKAAAAKAVSEAKAAAKKLASAEKKAADKAAKDKEKAEAKAKAEAEAAEAQGKARKANAEADMIEFDLATKRGLVKAAVEEAVAGTAHAMTMRQFGAQPTF